MKQYILALSLILFGFAACTEDIPEREASPFTLGNCQGVFFPTTNEAVIEMEPTEPTEMTITIARADATNAIEVPISIERNDDNVFVVPQKVNFAAGAKEVTFVVTFPTAAEGVTYNLKLFVSGAELVNDYADTRPYVATSVTRVKWDVIDDIIVMVNGFWGGAPRHYIPKAEIASYGSGDIVNAIRLTDPFLPAEGEDAAPDEYGIYNGHPDIWPDEVVRENVQLVITVDKEDKALIKRGGIGAMWYDIEMEIVMYNSAAYGTANRDEEGNIVSIDFPPGSLFIIANSANQGWSSGDMLQVYLSWEAYLADNMKIDDYNDVEYEEIPGAISEFESKAYGDGWDQSFFKAIDIDEENEESEYKDLYYLADLYANNYGLAFYYNGRTVKIPDNQPIGTKFMNQDIYVSQSATIESSVATSDKGLTVYSLGLKFHYKDGTTVGEFAETFYYSEDPVPGHISELYGDYILSGFDAFEEEDVLVEFPVSIAPAGYNTLAIDGIAWVGLVTAKYDPANSVMSIAPQVLDPYAGIAMQLHTLLPTWYTSTSAAMIFTRMESGVLVLTESSPAMGFLIWAGGGYGYQEGFFDIEFTPESSASPISVKKSTSLKLSTNKELRQTPYVKKEKTSEGNFKIQTKTSSKKARPALVFF